MLKLYLYFWSLMWSTKLYISLQTLTFQNEYFIKGLYISVTFISKMLMKEGLSKPKDFKEDLWPTYFIFLHSLDEIHVVSSPWSDAVTVFYRQSSVIKISPGPWTRVRITSLSDCYLDIFLAKMDLRNNERRLCLLRFQDVCDHGEPS